MRHAAGLSQFTIFGDTHHSYGMMDSVASNMQALKDSGQEYFFLEHHISLQPYIEKLRRHEIGEDEFRKRIANYNEDDIFSNQYTADAVINATKAGLRVIVFDMRSPEESGVKNAPEKLEDIVGYPEDLLPAAKQAFADYYDSHKSFDESASSFVSTVAGDKRASIWIGNGHINGSHEHGTPEHDFDGFLGVDRSTRIVMYYDIEQYAGSLEDYQNKQCREKDPADFVYFTHQEVDEGPQKGEIVEGVAITEEGLARGKQDTVNPIKLFAEYMSECKVMDKLKEYEKTKQLGALFRSEQTFASLDIPITESAQLNAGTKGPLQTGQQIII